MSMIPSLSVWSSVKFPFPKYFPDSKIPKPYSAESCDHFIKRNYEKTRAERATEMVNLRVPCNKNVEKENSVPNLYCECSPGKHNSKRKKKPRQIRFVVVPEIILYDKERTLSNKRISGLNFEPREWDSVLQEKGEECHFHKEKLGETDSVPSVKPWTLEELVEINRQKEEARKKMEARKNKIKNHARALKTLNRILPEDENLTFPKDSIHRDRFPDFTKNYGDCELYYSKLELEAGHTEKVNKTRWEEE